VRAQMAGDPILWHFPVLAMTRVHPRGDSMNAPVSDPSAKSIEPRIVAMDLRGRIRIPRLGAMTAALLRIALGLVYLWAFISQAFGITYTNQAQPPPDSAAGTQATYEWTFGFDADKGWITSGFDYSPTASYVDNNLHGPLAIIPQKLLTGVDDFMWMFALAGLGVGLTFGVFSILTGVGGLILNLLIWLSTFPPSTNPLIDGEHVTFALAIFLLMWIHASNYWGLGRWWRSHTPTVLN
jgi:thiosulfate dehydrogenase (quinone) large subunit